MISFANVCTLCMCVSMHDMCCGYMCFGHRGGHCGAQYGMANVFMHDFGYAKFIGVLKNKPPMVTFGSFRYQLFVFSGSSFRLEGYLMRY